MNQERGDHETRFKPLGVGVKHDTKPICVLLPTELDAYVRSLPNRSQWLREAIAEKMARDRQTGQQVD
jgi:hypothetical protein